MSEVRRARWLTPAAIFLLWLLLLGLGSPVLAWLGHRLLPRTLGNLLFFLPQLMIPFVGAVVRGPYGSTRWLSPVAGWFLSCSLWILMGIAFVGVAQGRRRPSLLWALAPAVIVLVTLVASLLLGVAGVPVELDGL